eukprot:5356105-Heterocapsa_arctica.AAC.1
MPLHHQDLRILNLALTAILTRATFTVEKLTWGVRAVGGLSSQHLPYMFIEGGCTTTCTSS